jgi:hypothetical protein
MANTTLDAYLGAIKEKVRILKTASRTSVAAIPFSVFDQAGYPAAGTMAVGNTTTGVVPTNATNGYPKIRAFAGANKGYLGAVTFGNSVACNIDIFDTLFSVGAIPFTAATTTLASQPSYAARVPDGYYPNNTEIWLEAVTAFTGNLSVAITYTNQDGVTGKTTGVVSTGAALIVGRMFLMPLAAGDTGVQKIESITPSVATAGTFNVHVLRRLHEVRVRINNDGDTHDFIKTGSSEVYANSALRPIVYADSTATGLLDLTMEVFQG